MRKNSKQVRISLRNMNSTQHLKGLQKANIQTWFINIHDHPSAAIINFVLGHFSFNFLIAIVCKILFSPFIANNAHKFVFILLHQFMLSVIVDDLST